MNGDTSPPTERSFADWNEEMVQRYDIDRYYREAHPLVRWVERRRLWALRRLAAPRAGERLLEVGVGGGHVLQQFPAQRRVGIDLSTSMLARTRGRLGRAVALARADAEQVPFRTGAFDVVVCTEVLEHTRAPAQVLRELARLAGPGGRIVISIPNEVIIDRIKHQLSRIPGLRRWLKTLAAEDNEWHLHRFDLRTLRQVAAGEVELAAVRGIPFRWLPVRYAVLVRAAQPSPQR
ncbi:MAG: class I SAM-dependent methyltransferase [Gemmatimonadetes bacterium]|nr:class I SAM-dependent methyltransferase [Gemmatimonadota bacterium]